MPSVRLAEKAERGKFHVGMGGHVQENNVIFVAAETATHFLVKWDEEQARYSVVKREVIVSDPPLLIGNHVVVKASDHRGHVQMYDGEIVAKGRFLKFCTAVL